MPPASKRSAFFTLVAALGVFATAFSLWAGDISVSLQVESRDVYVGESFMMQISVDGTDRIEEPDLGSLPGFSIEYLGGSNNSSQSITIINGRIQKSVHKGFVLSYRLTPKRTGRLTIPPIEVHAGGKVFRTDPVVISVRKPHESEDFKLRMSLSRSECYVGEPVVLTVTWYIGRNVRDFQFTMPLLDMDAFDFEDPHIKINNRLSYYRVPLGKQEVIAEKGRGMLDGQMYATLRFKKVLIPKKAGKFALPQTVVSCEAIVRRGGQSDFFDDFFSDNFFGMGGGKLRKYVVPSNTVSLDVKPLPEEGRPPGFAGHVGRYRISATAQPTDVNVGDPITLNIIVEGPDYLGNVDFPPLSEQPALERDFKIPSERAAGKIAGTKKIFTQTIRAKNDRVKEIPSIKLVYFDTEKGRYEVASTKPIPITVHPTRIVTARDAEGGRPVNYSNPIEKWKVGIAYNYEGPELLMNEGLGFASIVREPLWLAALAAPPALFFVVLLSLTMLRRRKEDVEGRKARGALKRLLKGLDRLKGSDISDKELGMRIMQLLREYVGDKLGRQGTTLTRAEIASELEKRRVSEGVRSDFIALVERFEAAAYAGAVSIEEGKAELLERAKRLARALDREMK